MLEGIGIAAGFLLGLLVLVWVGLRIAGGRLPAEHETSRSLLLNQAPEAIWLVITDFPQMPSWNPLVREIERLPDRRGHPVWRETYRNKDQLTLETTEAVAPRRLVRVIADENFPFRGSWEFAIEPAGVGSRLTVTERGTIPSPFIRLMFRLFHDPAKTLEEYLEALAARFAETARIEGRDEAEAESDSDSD
jgi:hypothetical protein